MFFTKPFLTKDHAYGISDIPMPKCGPGQIPLSYTLKSHFQVRVIQLHLELTVNAKNLSTPIHTLLMATFFGLHLGIEYYFPALGHFWYGKKFGQEPKNSFCKNGVDETAEVVITSQIIETTSPRVVLTTRWDICGLISMKLSKIVYFTLTIISLQDTYPVHDTHHVLSFLSIAQQNSKM